MLNIGITVGLRKGAQSIWSNGANMNVVFLWRLLKLCPGVGKVFLINCGDTDEAAPGLMFGPLGLEFVKFQDVADELDVLIECGAQISAEAVARVRANGGRTVTYKFGNAYVIDVEREIHGKESGSIFNGAVFDEVWTNPQHMDTCGSYWETCYRAPVRVLPHIWEPLFVDAALKEMPEGTTFGYKPGPGKKRISIFEPNINIVKTSHMPLLVCERAYRRSPDLMGEVYATCAIHMANHLAFQHFVANLDIQKAKLLSVEGRFCMPFFLAQHTDVVVSHQWENGLNYAYYDALYGRYPLVHNSPLLPNGVGYYYNGFDAGEGGNILASVLRSHDSRAEEYNSAAGDFLKTVLATAPANVMAHRDAIQRLRGGAPFPS